MSLYQQLLQRAAEQKPIRIGLIGAGKFGSMYLAQIPKTPGVQLVAVADLMPAVAKQNLCTVGWDATQLETSSIDLALRDRTCYVTDDWQAIVQHPAVDVVVECTGNPIAAVEHCLRAFSEGKHVVNVTVEADAFCGPLLAKKARDANVIYSLAFGDQP
ncbi:MAG: flagellar biosynthesis protein FlgA, partial [Burkholderiaceae bacterium]|nr:flagellar biosynthesis protein FlgA [Burkholderiaceae bacterium]